MKEVKRYETSDGILFKNKTKAKKHELLIAQLEKSKDIIWPRGFEDNGCEFANGGGYFQLTKKQVDHFMKELRILIKDWDSKLVKTFDKQPRGIIGRYLDDSNTPIYYLWGLLLQIDSSNRLWGQPYYALNPHKGKQVCLNKE